MKIILLKQPKTKQKHFKESFKVNNSKFPNNTSVGGKSKLNPLLLLLLTSVLQGSVFSVFQEVCANTVQPSVMSQVSALISVPGRRHGADSKNVEGLSNQ